MTIGQGFLFRYVLLGSDLDVDTRCTTTMTTVTFPVCPISLVGIVNLDDMLHISHWNFLSIEVQPRIRNLIHRRSG